MINRTYILNDAETGAAVWKGDNLFELARALDKYAAESNVILSIEKQVEAPAGGGNLQGAYRLKQIILIRKDLGMRRGKEIAQGAHASMAFLSHAVQTGDELPEVAKQWLDGSFAKVCVKVDSEEEMLDIVQKAQDAGLLAHAIQDNGTTEFHGQPTYTAAAIGPASAEDLEPITGNLKLY